MSDGIEGAPVGQLLVEAEGKDTTVLSFEDGNKKWTLGRDPDRSSFFIENPSIADQHLLFSLVDGALIAQNLASIGETSLNGEPLVAPTPLKEGDELKIGDLVLRYTLSDKMKAPPLSGGSEETSEENAVSTSRESIFDESAPEGVEGVPEVHFDLLEGNRFLLKVVGGPNSGAEFPLAVDHTYTIGTDSQSADIVFHDVSVSRQHATITLKEDGTLILKDLGSRNGTYLEENRIQDDVSLPPSKVVTLGTSTFIVLDNEGESSTIISPLLPSIVKVLQKQEEKARETADSALPSTVEEPGHSTFSLLGAFILIAVISTLLAIVGLGVRSLLTTEEVKTEKVDIQKDLQAILTPYPNIRYSYNDGNGRLLLVGHVLTNVERTELMLALQNVHSIRSIDDNIIVDEFVWKEANQILAQNTEWKGVSMVSPNPGVFAVTGVVHNRKQLDGLVEYLNQTFNFPELLDFRVVVEEDLVNQVISLLRNSGFGQVKPTFSDGQLRLTGNVTSDQAEKFQALVTELGRLPGIRTVQNMVGQQKVEAFTNISNRYKVSGYLDQGNGKSSVVINGRILTVGDALDGMTLTAIRPDGILLERDGEKFKIDNSR